MENTELLQDIYKGSEMGSYAIEKMLKTIENTKSKIKKILKEELKQYKKYKEKSVEFLKYHDEEPKDSGFFAKLGSGLEITMKVSPDEPESVSEILLKGLDMGIEQMSKQIDDYKEKANKEVLEFAKQFLDYQKEEQKKLKEYI